MDRNIIPIGHFYADQEAAAAAECHAAAAVNGHTADAADQCDDGDVKCPGCPFYALQEAA